MNEKMLNIYAISNPINYLYVETQQGDRLTKTEIHYHSLCFSYGMDGVKFRNWNYISNFFLL